MNIIPADTYEYSQRLWKVLKTNYSLSFANRIIHELFDNDNFGILEEEDIDILREFQTYRENRALQGNYKITKMTLPLRFGMYKTQINMPKTTEVELDTPCEESVADSTIEREDGTIHRVRGIF